MFTILKPSPRNLGPRLAQLALPSKKPIQTPHYLALTSRGVVPHITQDTFATETGVSGVFAGLEDCKSHRYKAPPTLHTQNKRIKERQDRGMHTLC